MIKNGGITVNSVVGKGMYPFSLKYLLTNTIKVLNNPHCHIIRASNVIEWPTREIVRLFFH